MNNSEKEIRNLESIAASINKLTKDTEAATRRDEYDTDAFNKAIDGYIANLCDIKKKNFEINANGLKEKQETAEAHQETAEAHQEAAEDEKKSSSVSVWGWVAIAAIGIGAGIWALTRTGDDAE